MIPGRVEAALTYLTYVDGVKNPFPAFDGAPVSESRDLTITEARVEDAALGVLLDYFRYKADFGDWLPKESANLSVELEILKDQVDNLERKTNGLFKKNTSSGGNPPQTQPPLE